MYMMGMDREILPLGRLNWVKSELSPLVDNGSLSWLIDYSTWILRSMTIIPQIYITLHRLNEQQSFCRFNILKVIQYRQWCMATCQKWPMCSCRAQLWLVTRFLAWYVKDINFSLFQLQIGIYIHPQFSNEGGESPNSSHGILSGAQLTRDVLFWPWWGTQFEWFS